MALFCWRIAYTLLVAVFIFLLIKTSGHPETCHVIKINSLQNLIGESPAGTKCVGTIGQFVFANKNVEGQNQNR